MLKSGHRIGNYEIQALLGVGGMAMVYSARHLAMGTNHAIKVLLPNYATQARTVERFRLEARAQFRLRHPNFVQVTDYIDDPDAPALVMDLIDGVNLRQAMQQRTGPWQFDDVLPVMLPVLEGMELVHNAARPAFAVPLSLGSFASLTAAEWQCAEREPGPAAVASAGCTQTAFKKAWFCNSYSAEHSHPGV